MAASSGAEGGVNDQGSQRLDSPVADLTVFFPAHDEEGNVEAVVRGALRVLPRITADFEVLVVDDGSRDRTAEIVLGLAREDPRVRLARHETNLGYGAALRTGFREARKSLVFWTDGDDQFDLEELPRFVSELRRADVVIGYRLNRQDPPVRRLNGFAWSTLVRLLFRVRSRDVDCAYKVAPRRLLEALRCRADGAMISTEFLARAQQAGARIREVGVHHRPRRHGVSSGGDIRVILRAFRELFRLYGELRGGETAVRGWRTG
jgi:glycosyltransferase involved in cell wall biosynthesis